MKKASDALLPSKRSNSGTAASDIRPNCSAFQFRLSGAASKNWNCCPTIQRRAGPGGQVQVEKKVTPDSELESNLDSLVETRTAGDPDDQEIRFTDLTPTRIESELAKMGTPASDDLVRRWMDEQGLRLRKINKVIAGGHSDDRDTQFLKIASLIDEFKTAEQPYFSIDTKSKEFLGRLFRSGRVRCDTPFKAFDHDFPSWADGRVIPHGIYDPVRNCGHVNIGISRDTTQFACDSIQWYWNRIGQQCYPNATKILLLFDGGGSNSARKYLFKHDLQQVADRIGLEIRVAHYPSYCSKYNPIERRFFPHLSRVCTGMLFDALDTVVGLMKKATTATGLKTTVNVIKRLYETGRKATDQMKDHVRSSVLFDDVLPKWNYTIKPKI